MTRHVGAPKLREQHSWPVRHLHECGSLRVGWRQFATCVRLAAWYPRGCSDNSESRIRHSRGGLVSNPSASSSTVDVLVRRLDAAASVQDTKSICRGVKDVLIEELGGRRVQVPSEYTEPVPSGYARRLLHRDPAGRFSVVVMVWGPGQRTPLHDHAGHWCVECVYEGRVRVTSYDLENERENDVFFKQVDSVVSEVGAAGALIPPFEYHTIENPFDTKAITVHVYRGELTWCHAFEPSPRQGWYRRSRHELSYSA